MISYSHEISSLKTLVKIKNFLVAQIVKNLPVMLETWVQFPRWGSSPGGGHGNSLLYSCLKNSMGGGGWRSAVHREEIDDPEAT